ncbi:MAG: hypothetical protein AAB618_02400 [Patescibacteria group bacterium]
MAKIPPANKKLIKEKTAQIKVLQEKLERAQKLEGKDDFIAVKIQKNQARFQRIKQKGVEDKAVGKFYIEINITAKQQNVFVPISIASGKKTAGFMYQIEGTAQGSIATANVEIGGQGISQVTIGTLRYAKIPTGKTASFEIRAVIRGNFGRVYKIVFTRLNYKLNLTDVRYQQYLKEIQGESVTFS